MFFDKLQALCDEKGIAMSALLDQVGMSRGNMARWKEGLTPKPATQIKLAEALGVFCKSFPNSLKRESDRARFGLEWLRFV